MDEKGSTTRQNLPVLGKPCRYANDILLYICLEESKELSLIKSSFDKAEESIEKSERKYSSTFSLQGRRTIRSTNSEIDCLQVLVEQTDIE